MSIKTKSNVRFIIAIPIIVLILLLGAVFPIINQNVIPLNKARAQTIIDAIYVYQQQNGNFPNYLNDLRPNFLQEIPSTLFGTPFFYFTNAVDGFGVGFMVNDRFGCGYTDQYKNWECSHGD